MPRMSSYRSGRFIVTEQRFEAPQPPAPSPPLSPAPVPGHVLSVPVQSPARSSASPGLVAQGGMHPSGAGFAPAITAFSALPLAGGPGRGRVPSSTSLGIPTGVGLNDGWQNGCAASDGCNGAVELMSSGEGSSAGHELVGCCTPVPASLVPGNGSLAADMLTASGTTVSAAQLQQQQLPKQESFARKDAAAARSRKGASMVMYRK
jgi:hypothetical protein